jgi:hypothetical protein
VSSTTPAVPPLDAAIAGAASSVAATAGGRMGDANRRLYRLVQSYMKRWPDERFRTSHENAGRDDFPILLVDSEAPVVEGSPWEHVRLRPGDGWARPEGASDDQIHLMVQAMEAWFHADQDALRDYYGQCFRIAGLSQRQSIEQIPKADLLAGLKRATKDCLKGEYSKGAHSFQILAQIDPVRVGAASPFVERSLKVLDRACNP